MFRLYPIASALTKLFEDPDVARHLRLREFVTHPPHPNAVRDPDRPSSSTNRLLQCLYDASGWRDKVIESGFRGQNEYNITLALSSDGYQPSKRGHYSIWPILLEVLNLPEELRFKPCLIILAGLVPGPNKPASITPYLNVVVNQINELNRSGFSVYNAHTKTTMRIQVQLLFTIADYPAHGLINCQMGAPATWACHKCKIKVRAHTFIVSHWLYPRTILVAPRCLTGWSRDCCCRFCVGCIRGRGI